MNMDTSLLALDTAEVVEVARRALGSNTAHIVGWEVSPLSYDRTTPSSSGVYRVAGTAIEGGQCLQWSVVLKVLQSPAGMTMPNGAVIPHDLPDDPGLFGYWKREALAQEAGILRRLPGGVAAPRCYGVTAPVDGMLWLWQEDVTEGDLCWNLEQYRLAAQRLGRFNGAYLAGLTVPTYPWLAGGWLRSWLALPATGMMARIKQSHAWERPTVRRAFPASVAGRVDRLWQGQGTLLTALESLPQVLCHRDAFRPNLFIRSGRDGTDGVVAIDWAFVGPGPVGEEIAPLITMQPAGGKEGFAPWRLEAPVFDAYLQGLDDAGWRGDPNLVRFGYAASAALRYILPTVTELSVDLCDERRWAEVEARRGMQFERAVEQQVALTEFLLDLADEATSLLKALAYSEREQRVAIS
ncbi:MAG: aminoglycoside phosphotransferase family protein [Chloroflexota bacterium]|nr:aminoglycoside phosphotransferase family protein [Chloroflexota bacterium]